MRYHNTRKIYHFAFFAILYLLFWGGYMQEIGFFFVKSCIFQKKAVILQAEMRYTMRKGIHRYNYIGVILALSTLLLISCSDKNRPEPTDLRGEVLDTELVKELSLAQVRKIATDSIDSTYLHYPIQCYRVTYSSVYEGEPITTTALMLLPKCDTADKSLCVYMHGTNWPIEKYSAQQNMPSNYFNRSSNSGGEVATCGIPLASSGLAVIMPDYIGYGPTADKEHPFIYYPELKNANIDALRALRNYLKLKGKQDVRLAGWSQGGGAALSLHYYIQTDYSSEFNVLSSSCLSGPYNYAGLLEGVLRDSTGLVPPTALCTWSVYVLNRFAVHRNPDQIYTFTVTDQVSAMMNFVGTVWDCFRPYFTTGLLTGADTEWIRASEKNSFHKGWKPTGKVYLHHGTKDPIVPYFNTADAYKGLKDAGGDITLYAYEGKNHFNVTFSFINHTLEDWER